MSIPRRWIPVACLTVVAAMSPATGSQLDQRGGDPAETDAFISWARSQAIPLLPVDASPATPLIATQRLAALDEVIGAAKVVALGEPAHGAHEPLAFRNRLFAWLVERHHFTAIALESGLCESRGVSDFVLGHAGDATQVARGGLTWGFGGFDDNVKLIRWMRDYNADPAHTRKISFYGIDLCGGDDAGFPNAKVALARVLAYLAHVAPKSARRARATLESHLGQFNDRDYRSLPRADRLDVRTALEELRTLLVHRRRELVARSTEADFEWALREAFVAQRLERALDAWPREVSATGVSAQSYRATTIREAAMAENVRWALEREGPGGRILLFAHNGHVQNGFLHGGLWYVYPRPPQAMGGYLRSTSGDALRIIGAAAGADGPGLPTAVPHADGLDEALGAVGLPCFLLDLRAARINTSAYGWLARPRPLRANFTTEIILSPAAAFDALVFFGRLTPEPTTIEMP